MRTGFAVQNSVARTGSSEVRRSSNPTPMKTIPLRIIKTQMVVATFARPIVAANDWMTVANGPYTEDCFFHIAPTAKLYAWSPHARGLVVYGFPPCAAMRPYAA